MRHKLIYFANFLHPIELILFLILIWALFWPLLFPNWKSAGYILIEEDDIIDDLYSCPPTHTHGNEGLPLCPLWPPNLESFININTDKNDHESIATKFLISPGGHHTPSQCVSRHRVAIIVPYRNRSENLKIFSTHLHAFLYKQLIEYQLFIVEQSDDNDFNRAKLFNIGFVESLKFNTNFCCFIFHDVDLLPQNEKQLYVCSKRPRHMCSALDKFRYVLIYPDLFGGAVAIRKDQFEAVNGFSNEFVGWGGEDDDFYNRIKRKHITITRWDSKVARCMMLTHKKETPNPSRMELLNDGFKRFDKDGLNSIANSYKVLSVEREPLYTLIKVNLLQK